MIYDELLYVSVEEIEGFLGGKRKSFSEERTNSSELRNHSSEVSFASSELLFRPSVGKIRFLPDASRFPREDIRINATGGVTRVGL